MDRIDHIGACFRYASRRTPTAMFIAQWHRWRSARLKLGWANKRGGRGPAMSLINRTGRRMGEAYRRHKAAQPAPLSFRELMADMTVPDETTMLRAMPWTEGE